MKQETQNTLYRSDAPDSYREMQSFAEQLSETLHLGGSAVKGNLKHEKESKRLISAFGCSEKTCLGITHVINLSNPLETVESKI